MSLQEFTTKNGIVVIICQKSVFQNRFVPFLFKVLYRLGNRMKQEENLYHITNLQNPSQKKQGKYQLSKYYILEQLVLSERN